MTSKHLDQIPSESTSHKSGQKRVFLRNEDQETSLTQFAHGYFKSGEKCPLHKHPTMEELFYFMEGRGEYLVGEDIVSIEPGLFLRIPANVLHELRANKGEDLKFVYFGISTE